jgi:membrane-associated phospholipid phosphatase/tRNA A-37 threonylcarbamoyl transferase component Bud32
MSSGETTTRDTAPETAAIAADGQVSTSVPFPEGAKRSAYRRRPTGESPPLPRHMERTGVGLLAASIALLVVSMVLLAANRYGRGISITVADTNVLAWLADARTPAGIDLAKVLAGLGAWQLLKVLGVATVISLLVFKRFRHLVVMWLSLNAVLLVVIGLSAVVRRPRPLGIPIEGSWSGFSMPSRPVAFLAAFLFCVLYTLIPKGRWRQLGKLVTAVLVTLLGAAEVYLGVSHPTDVLVAATLGVTVPLLAFRLVCPDSVFPVRYRRGRTAHLDVTGARGEAIHQALSDQLGLDVKDVKPFNLSGSAGSTPLRITVAGEPDTHLFGKLYARNHLRADRWYKLGRELLYGRLEDEKAFNTVRRLVQQEDYALHKLHQAGLPVPQPYGFVELTPDREYLLVAEFFEDAVELGDAEVDDQIIDDGLSIIRNLWTAGLAHRDIKPANLLVRDGRLLLIDVFFVEVRPSPWREAVDLANMMLCLALRSDPARVYERALRQFTVEEITEAFAAARGLAMPSQLRRMLREKGHDLHEQFIGLLPERPRPVGIQRWTRRRVGLVLAALVMAVLVTFTFISILGSDRLDTAVETSPACTNLEPLWLMAESVPSASMIPCLEVLPAGLVFNDVKINADGARFRFNRMTGPDTQTQALVAWLHPSCDPTGSSPVPTDEPGTQRYERVERHGSASTIVRTYVFPGGCMVQRWDPPADLRVQPADEARLAIGFVTRDELAATLEQRSGGRLHLDPEPRR